LNFEKIVGTKENQQKLVKFYTTKNIFNFSNF
jgi:hypothetical protein